MKCRLCESSKTKIIKNKLRYNIKRNVWKCLVCGYVFLEQPKQTTASFYSGKEYRANYGPKLGKRSNCRDIFNTYSPFQQPIIKEIKKILKPSASVLDIGCSTGHFLASLRGKVKIRVGLELSRENVDFINKNLDFNVYNNPLAKANIKEAPFDVITCLQVLEHAEDPLNFLIDIKKFLKPKGYLYLEMPNINDVLMSCYEIKEYEDFYFREPHISYFSKKTLGILLAKAGFIGKIKTVQRYTIMNHVNWILTKKPQSDFILGNSDPVLVKDSNKCVDKRVKNDLNNLINNFDKEYKTILEKYDLGESLTFLGQIK